MNIKEIRKKAKMTQAELAQYLEIPKRTIENWETEKRKCPEYTIKLIKYRIERKDEDEKNI